MNEHMIIGELFYCLIQDIEDYTMLHNDNTKELNIIVEKLCNIKMVYDANNTVFENHILQLQKIEQQFKEFGYAQFEQDIQEIIRRLK